VGVTTGTLAGATIPSLVKTNLLSGIVEGDSGLHPEMSRRAIKNSK
jgi:hypothetical protein